MKVSGTAVIPGIYAKFAVYGSWLPDTWNTDWPTVTNYRHDRFVMVMNEAGFG